jgi:hypothetical protein
VLTWEERDNPRNLPCPTCGCPNRLTRIDVHRGYQCDTCWNRQEQGLDILYCEDAEDANPEWEDD